MEGLSFSKIDEQKALKFFNVTWNKQDLFFSSIGINVAEFSAMNVDQQKEINQQWHVWSEKNK